MLNGPVLNGPVLSTLLRGTACLPDRGQRSLYLTSAAGVILVVTGNATWAQLRELAAALRPVTH